MKELFSSFGTIKEKKTTYIKKKIHIRERENEKRWRKTLWSFLRGTITKEQIFSKWRGNKRELNSLSRLREGNQLTLVTRPGIRNFS